MLKLADKGEPENGHGVASSCNVRLHPDDANRFGARSTTSHYNTIDNMIMICDIIIYVVRCDFISLQDYRTLYFNLKMKCNVNVTTR